jgi:hypothetical protein
MPPAIPNYDLGLLITLDIGLALQRIDLRLRRQFADVDRELQEIKELLGGTVRRGK